MAQLEHDCISPVVLNLYGGETFLEYPVPEHRFAILDYHFLGPGAIPHLLKCPSWSGEHSATDGNDTLW
jgi:hypothetical protein